MGESQGNHRYGMIIGCDILSGLIIYLCLSDYTIRWKRVAYEVCTNQIKLILKTTLTRPQLVWWLNLLEQINMGKWTCIGCHTEYLLHIRLSLSKR